jgi:broad specificity phosphatase PhoE
MTAKDDKKDRNLILIAELSDSDLTEKLFRFALEAREVATDLAAQKVQEKLPGEAKDDRTSSNNRSQNSAAILGDYFDEFAGESSSNPPAYTGKRVVTHGAIVSALAAHLKGNGSMRKSQAIDLAVDCSTHNGWVRRTS